MKNIKTISFIILTLAIGECLFQTVAAEEALRVASHYRKPTQDEIAKRESIEPLAKWLSRCSRLTEGTERSFHKIDQVYRQQKVHPPQSNPRFSKVTGPCSIFCKLSDDGTLHDFKVMISSGDADFDNSGLLVLKAQRRFPKCPINLPYERGVIVNFSNLSGQARRSAFIAPALIDPDRFYTGVSGYNKSSNIYSEIYSREPVPVKAKVSVAELQKIARIIDRLSKLKNDTPGYIVLAKCRYIEALIKNGDLSKCPKQLDELAEFLQYNSFFAIRNSNPSHAITSLLISILESEDKKYSDQFLTKLDKLIEATENNTDYGIFTKEPAKTERYNSWRSNPKWITYKRFAENKNKKQVKRIIDSIYSAKQKRFDAGFFNNQFWMNNLASLAKERKDNKMLEKSANTFAQKKKKMTATFIIGTVENMIEDGDPAGAEKFINDVLQNDLIKSDSRRLPKILGEMSILFANSGNLDLADKLLRHSMKVGTGIDYKALYLLIDKYRNKNEFEKACALYQYVADSTGRYIFRAKLSELQLEASVKDSGRKDYWFQKSEDTYQSLLNYLLKTYGDKGSGVFNTKLGRVKAFEKFGYQREADLLRNQKKNLTKGSEAQKNLKILSSSKDLTAPQAVKAQINVCRWLVQSKNYKDASKQIIDLASVIKQKDWKYDREFSKRYPRMASDLDYLWGESFAINELKEPLKTLIDAVEKHMNRALTGRSALYYGKRYDTLKSKIATEELEYIFKVKKNKFESISGDKYLGSSIETWLEDLIQLAEYLKHYDDALIFLNARVKSEKLIRYKDDYYKALMNRVRIKLYLQDVEGAESDFEKIDLDKAKEDLIPLCKMAAALSDAGQLDMAMKATKAAVMRTIHDKNCSEAFDRFVLACKKSKKYKLATELLDFAFEKHQDKSYCKKILKKKREEVEKLKAS